MTSRLAVLAAALALGGATLALGGAAAAQPAAVHKDTLQTDAFPGGGAHTVLVHTVVDPGGVVALHTHPGLEVAYVVTGSAHVHVQGRPDLDLTDGGSFTAPPATPHSVTNTGPGPLVLVSTYVVDPAKPIATPIAPPVK